MNDLEKQEQEQSASKQSESTVATSDADSSEESSKPSQKIAIAALILALAGLVLGYLKWGELNASLQQEIKTLASIKEQQELSKRRLDKSDQALAERYHRIGEALGLAFQIQDDLLGIWGEAEVTGKPIADDIRRRKKSLPVVYLLGKQNDPDARRLRALYAQDILSEEEVDEAVSILDASQARPYAEKLAQQHLETALFELEAARPEAEAGEALRELAHFLIRRTY